ncbi:putative beta-lactamase HcpC [Sycon ciliatum]|uniref:putative beta-lactamase HcpC n=1 Tax=Sycon ciliatum TaxID=27933 RepID=UPI0031F6661C|eukprot:scpid28582/ scgid18517/ Sel1 repeat-containing protein 1; Beta-lactamase hcp-like protein SELRC1
MGAVFAKKKADDLVNPDQQLQERKDYADNLRAQLSIKCHREKNLEACHALGEFFLAFDKNKFMAKDVLHKNCHDAKHGESCLLLGQVHLSYEGEDDRDVKAAMQHFTEACRLNVGGGCTMAGIVHGMGIDGVYPVNLQAAADAFGRGCDLDDKVGCFQGGMIARYAPTPDIVADHPRAASMFSKACDKGSLMSCREVATMYEKGIGVPVDAAKAHEYHEKSLPMFRPDEYVAK